jgi:predicted component of type VI protein secretion system
MYEYGIGGTERPTDANEAFADLPQNKTLVVEKLTADDDVETEVVKGLTSVEDVFKHFRPKAEVEFQGEDGSEVKEQLSFNNLGEFGPQGLTKQSDHLGKLNMRRDEMARIVKQLRSNKKFLAAMQDPSAKTALIEVLNELLGEVKKD